VPGARIADRQAYWYYGAIGISSGEAWFDSFLRHHPHPPRSWAR